MTTDDIPGLAHRVLSWINDELIHLRAASDRIDIELRGALGELARVRERCDDVEARLAALERRRDAS